MYMSNPCSLFPLYNTDLCWVLTFFFCSERKGRRGGDVQPHPKFLTGSSIDQTP